jgi:hypothetical protein
VWRIAIVGCFSDLASTYSHLDATPWARVLAT